MIRVLHLIATLDPAGAECQMAQTCIRLDRARFAPSVCCLTRGGPLETALAEAGIPVTILNKHNKYDLSALFRLRRLIKRLNPHILHTWLPTANTLGRIAAVGCRIPVIIAAERAADIWKGPLRRWLDRRLQPRTAHIITNAHAVREFLVNRIGLQPHNIAVIPNGLDLGQFDAAAEQPCASLPPTPRGPVIGTVGRLEPQKGTTHLIAAMGRIRQALPDAQLWIIGDGPDRLRLAGQTTDAGLQPQIRFLGYRRDVPALLKHLDLFVLPSLWEGLPNAVLEAMAAGRAVVATRVNGTPEAVGENETGILVPPADPDALARAVIRLLHDTPLRSRMAAAGRRRVAQLFSMEKMIARTESLYHRLLRETQPHD